MTRFPRHGVRDQRSHLPCLCFCLCVRVGVYHFVGKGCIYWRVQLKLEGRALRGHLLVKPPSYQESYMSKVQLKLRGEGPNPYVTTQTNLCFGPSVKQTNLRAPNADWFRKTFASSSASSSASSLTFLIRMTNSHGGLTVASTSV